MATQPALQEASTAAIAGARATLATAADVDAAAADLPAARALGVSRTTVWTDKQVIAAAKP